jgi:tRNA threonylcarbamoyl adenosine modification protein YeaZ/ribosomal-protein-alanine acetyltransferase
MPVLCLDTATDRPAAALLAGDGTLLRGIVHEGRAQGLLGRLDELLDGIDRSTIDAVVVGTGPGTFTGLRVGVATARGLAEALGVPLYGTSSMLATAAELALADCDRIAPVWAVLAAGRGEHFVQPIRSSPDGQLVAVEPIRAVAASDLTDILGDDPMLVVRTPSPASLAAAAACRIELARIGDEAGDALLVVPTYGREPDATPPRIEVAYDELGEADLDAIERLERRCFATPWSRGQYAEELARPARDAVRLAARDRGADGRLVGAALAARIGDCWHVLNVLVDPTARGRGIATSLVQQLVDRTRELGAGEGWTLEVRDGNGSAIRLYERHGFEHAGRRPGYYADTGDDALVMWRYATDADRVEATR